MTTPSNNLTKILERIAVIQIGIQIPDLGNPYVLSAFAYQPSDISSIQLPTWINEIRGGPSDTPIAAGQQYITSNIYMNLLVARKEANVDLKYGVKETAQWRDAVYAKFASHLKLSAPASNIKSSTNANPIVITTGTPHGLETGAAATISGHLVNTAANGSWIVTVIDFWTFTIPTAGNGTGGATGTVRKTQPNDLYEFLTDASIINWDLVPYVYGPTDEGVPNFLALQFILRVREMFTTPLST